MSNMSESKSESELESESKINYFLSLHKILISNDKFTINYINENCCEINYFNNIFEIKYTYNININKLDLIILSNDIISSHIKRLLESKKILSIKFSENIITEYLFVLGELAEKYFNYCSICGTELKIKGIQKISCCDNLECIKLSYQTVMDNKVINAYRQDSHVFLFLLNILITGTYHLQREKAYKPLPCIKDINNLVDLKNLIETEKNFLLEEKIIKILNECENDTELINKTNHQVYSILKNATSNNYFSMSSMSSIGSNNNITKNSIKFIQINYSADIENKFKQNHFLFHGSGICSWYPIVKNGLKVMSGTSMMTNGAAFGYGIYFSDSFEMSYGYSSRANLCTIGSTYNSIVGVFEVCEEPLKYKKSAGVFVINDDKIILLRTLVLIKSGTKIPKDISNYFLQELPLQKQSNKLNVGILKNKRLEGEYKKLSTLNFITIIDIHDQNKWQIYYEPIKNKQYSIELIFSNYPINPPIIKLLSRNKQILGLVDSNYNITIDLINPANWKITNNLSDITTQLYKCFQESL